MTLTRCFPICLLLLAACGSSTAPQLPARADTVPGGDPAITVVTGVAGILSVSNGLVERSWQTNPFQTLSFTDLRTGQAWSQDTADFAFGLGPASIDSTRFAMTGSPAVEALPNGGVRVTATLAPAPAAALPLGLNVIRTIEIYPGVAGVRVGTTLQTPVPLLLSSYILDQATPPEGTYAAQAHAFRAGADWREPEWGGPPLVVGDAQPGDWRDSTSGPEVDRTAQWLSVADAQDRRLFMVLERNDHSSSTMRFAGGIAAARVDLNRDVIYLGPFEEQVHVGPPGSAPGRVRIVMPGSLPLEWVFSGLALDADDEPWQHHKFLAGHRMAPYRREVTFNSNGVDDNRISTGAKDDMDFPMFLTQLDVARQIGVETFIFDDGWQARSGDWCPDSVSDDPACADPRRGTDPKFEPRFPDPEFSAVRAELAPHGMNLGLWMSPMHFHPRSTAFTQHPEWACLPLSAGLVAANLAQPDSSSNEAGIGQWNPEALSLGGGKLIGYIEGRIRHAIDVYGSRYFKFDFTAWLDCAGAMPVDFYAYRESFRGMLDRILADHPDVTIQMDETNDYRLFPFESIARGPSWYQNGSPTPPEALHANQVLAPWIPLYSLGRNALRAGDLANYTAGYQMAVALLSHMTFFNDLTQIPAEAIPEVRLWTDYYKAHREDLATFAYPLLDEDPVTGDNWAAFQTWDADAARGALLVYRQDSGEAVRTIRLRNLRDGRYRLHEAPDESGHLDFDAAQLRGGIEVGIPAQRQARVWRIQRLP